MKTMLDTLLEEVFLELDQEFEEESFMRSRRKCPQLKDLPWAHMGPRRGGRWYIIQRGDNLWKVARKELKRVGAPPERLRDYMAMINHSDLNERFLNRKGWIGRAFLPWWSPKDRRTRRKSGEQPCYGMIHLPKVPAKWLEDPGSIIVRP